MQEDLLDLVPSERLRFTTLGATILITTCIATISFGTALFFAFGNFGVIELLITLLWGLLVLTFDRWLTSGPSLSGTRQFASRVLSRLILAIVFGVLVAEPLLLGIFNTAIEGRVAQSRQELLLQFESKLRTCNQLSDPENGEQESRNRCDGFRLTSSEPVRARQTQLQRLQDEKKELQQEIDGIVARGIELEDAARRECAGVGGPGTTGKSGEGPNCKRLRAVADRYIADSDLDGKQDRLMGLNSAITVTAVGIDNITSQTIDATEQSIEAEVDRAAASQRGVGLLERLRALGDLTSQNSYVYTAGWMLRVTFVLVEILPALMRIVMGTSEYDRLVRIREKGQIDRWMEANAHVAHDLFDALESRQRELIGELPIRAASRASDD